MKRIAVVLVVLQFAVAGAFAQTQTTSQISGTVTDPSGAVVPNAQITVTNQGTGLVRKTESNNSGYYSVPLLDPGAYVITVQAQGFQTVSRDGVAVAVGHSALIDFKLQVGTVEQKVSVSAAAPLIEPDNPNTTTTLNATQLANMPNPGNDLSYVANLAPGAIVNTGSTNRGGSAKVEFNGLPSVANNFSIDGLDANNPFFGNNAFGASGLQLGLNSIQEVSINTASYSVDQGRQEAAQINYITKSGANNFHGNAYEIWNGSAMNARSFFNNALGIQKKPRSNVNEFGTSVGGPIVKNTLFFFTDVEGIRIVLPTTLMSTLPTSAYQTYVLQQLPQGGKDTVFGTQLPPQPGEVPLYQNMFKLMGDTSGGIPLAVLGCPFDVGGGSPATANDGNGCATRKTASVTPPSRETLFTTKLDYTLSPQNTFWFRFQLNNGSLVIPDPVSPVFNTVFSGPSRTGTAGWTHVFSANLINHFNPGLAYSQGLSDIADPSKAHALLPISYAASPFSTIGGNQSFFPVGTATTVWQLNDNLAWNHGRHALKFGENMRRVLLSNFNAASFVIPFGIACTLPEFTFGATCNMPHSFPKVVGDRIAWVNLDVYAMDTFRATNKLTLTIGVRTAWNSNPVSRHNAFSRLADSFESISHDVNQPLNQVILPNQANPFAATPLLQWQPRAALAYQVKHDTVFRAGFGVFATTLEGLLTSQLSGNIPLNPRFSGGLFGAAGGIGIAPGVPNSAVDATVAANQQFQANFAGGALSCRSPLASPSNCLTAASFTAFSGRRQEYPYSMQWSTSVEHQFRQDFGLRVNYVGTRALKMLYQNAVANVSQSWCQGCFAPLPFQTAPDLRFAGVKVFNTGANSSYHALQVTAQKRMSQGLSFQLNYTYSHCLDTFSNGSPQAFNGATTFDIWDRRLRRYYGSCDYDIRHSLNGYYLYELPLHSSRGWLDSVIGGWQISGTAFLRSGFPFSVVSQQTSLNFTNGSPISFANLVPGQDPYTRTNVQGVTQPGTLQWLNPNAFQSIIDTTTRTCFPATNTQNCQDGNLGRNAFRAPGFKWTDLDIGKRFKISEKVGFRFDAQFYNLFNHPNFFFPSSVSAGIPGKIATLRGFGAINQTASPETGLLGGHGSGGDSSVRMIAFRGQIEF